MWSSMLNASTQARKDLFGLTGEERREKLIYKKAPYKNYKAFAMALLKDRSGKGHGELQSYYLLKSVKNSLLVAISENLTEFQDLLGEGLEKSALYYLLAYRRDGVGKNHNSSSLRQLRVCIDVLKNHKSLDEFLDPLNGQDSLSQCFEFVLRYERADEQLKTRHKASYEQALLKLITSVKSPEQKVSFFLSLDTESDHYNAAKKEIKGCFKSRNLNNHVFHDIIKGLTQDGKKEEIIRLLAAADRRTYLEACLGRDSSLIVTYAPNARLFSRKLNCIINPNMEMNSLNPN